MHAFDLGKLNGEIVVRRGREGEKLVLLDESEVELDAGVLAICDADGPVAIAGIMGGLDSGVTENTQDILFESAYFNPATIMGKARDFGMHTDASHRFERGVDPQGQVAAVERATALLIEIAGGTPGPVLLAEDTACIPRNQAVELRPGRLDALVGCDIPGDTAEAILRRLGMEVTWQEDRWTVTAPPSRFDIEIEEDLIEEVARIYGYNIPEAPVSGELAAGMAAGHQVSLQRVRESLCAAGYQEVINYSFVDRRQLADVHQAGQVLPLANPLSQDMDVMRTTLLPGLLSALGWQVPPRAKCCRSSGAKRPGPWIFSISRVTLNGCLPCEASAASLNSNPAICRGCTPGPARSSSWRARRLAGAVRFTRAC